MNIAPDVVSGGWAGLSWARVEDRKESTASVAYSAVLHSSTNLKFCADPTVARKQLTVKWRDQRD